MDMDPDMNLIVDSGFCEPAKVYAIIATILILCGFILGVTRGYFNLSGTSIQLCSIILCTIILMGICNIEESISWVIVIIFIICVVSGLVSAVTGRTADFVKRM